MEGREGDENTLKETRGRKLILNKDLIEKAGELLKEGHYQRTVCDYFGISEQTWYAWLNKGEEYRELEDEQLEEIPNAHLYIEFYEVVKKSSSWAEMEASNAIKNHGKKSWQAHAWFLERRFRERWGRVNQDESGQGGESQLDNFLKGIDKIVNDHDEDMDDMEGND